MLYNTDLCCATQICVVQHRSVLQNIRGRGSLRHRNLFDQMDFLMCPMDFLFDRMDALSGRQASKRSILLMFHMLFRPVDSQWGQQDLLLDSRMPHNIGECDIGV